MGRILVGDVGGTNTRFGAWVEGALVGVHRWPTTETPSLAQARARYESMEGASFDAAAVAVAGPVQGGRARLTNADWSGETGDLPGRGLLLNDLEAAAWCLPALTAQEVEALDEIPVDPLAPAVLIGVGTGLGEALFLGDRVLAGEGGHADLASPSPRVDDMLRWMRAQPGGPRISWEHLLSGPGLGRLLAYACRTVAPSEALRSREGELAPEVLVSHFHQTDPAAALAVDLFVELLAAEIGNAGLRVLATGGIWLVGGVVDHLASALGGGRLRAAVDARPHMRELVQGIPIRRVLHPYPALLGGAVAIMSGRLQPARRAAPAAFPFSR